MYGIVSEYGWVASLRNAGMPILQIEFDEADALLDWQDLANSLCEGHKFPKAHIRDELIQSERNTVLSRLALIDGLGYAVKTAAIFPGNSKRGIPTVNGAMVLLNCETGEPEVLVDFHLVTKWKTAGDSILAAKHLARQNSKRILIVGAGTVAKSMIYGYRSLFPGARFLVWNRTEARAANLVSEVSDLVATEVATDLEDAVRNSDIVSCATMATEPLIRGSWLSAGTHLDLIGAYRPDMREADDEAFRRSRVFVDSRDTTLGEIGELIAPIASCAICKDDVLADFYDLPAGKFRRRSDEEITLFKNGGGAHLDLMTARYILDAWSGKERAERA